MSVEKNETAIQVLKILYSQQKKKKLKKTHYNKVYPRNIEAKYKTKLTNFYKPLVNFVDTFLQENQVQMLRGDSKEIKCDAMPGGTFRRMVQSLEGWVSVYMPTVAEMKEGQNNVIFMGLNQTAEQIKQHEDAQFQKQLQNGIGVSFQTNASWWPNTKASWAQNNYNLITSNARNYISQINTLCEQAVVNGYSVKQLQEQIKKASNGLTDKKCRLIARDQIGKLQGQVSQAQMEEVGLEMYVWETSGDERVRSTHIPMDGLLCRWDDANVYSADGGKTWVDRPAGAIRMHPGQDIQCRCVALAYFPELESEVFGTPMEYTESEEVETVKEKIELNEEQKELISITDDLIKKASNYNLQDWQIERIKEIKEIISKSNNNNIKLSFNENELLNEILKLNEYNTHGRKGEGIGWGFARGNNGNGLALSYMYGKRYYPINEKTRMLDKSFKGDLKLQDLMKMSQYSKINNPKFKKSFDNMASSSELSYFLRAETRTISEVSKWKVGDKLDWVGVTSVSSSKAHNDDWLESFCYANDTQIKCRFHIKRTKEFEDSIVMIQNADTYMESDVDKFPEDLVSICSGIKIDKIGKENNGIIDIFVTPFL